MTTVHAYTATQAIIDRPNKKRRRGRAAAANLIPSSTGAAIATTKALPQYAGKFDGVAVRVPLAIGSLADLVFSQAGARRLMKSTRSSEKKPAVPGTEA